MCSDRGATLSTSTLVFFGLAEPLVDDILEELTARGCCPRRGLVLGVDMNRLAGLAAHWSSQIELVVVRLPASGPEYLDVVEPILEREGISIPNALLVHPCREEPDPSVFTGPSVGVPRALAADAATLVAEALGRLARQAPGT